MDATKDTIMGYGQNTEKVMQCRRKPKLLVNVHKADKPTPSELIALGNDKYISVRKRGFDLFLNMRQYKRDAHGRLLATKRGIMLSTVEWAQLKSSVKQVDKKLKQRQAKMTNID